MSAEEETKKNFELKEIERKFLEEGENSVSGIELLAYILGDFSDGNSSLSIVEDLLSFFGGWEGVFEATREELKEFNQLEENDIELIFAIQQLEKLMKTIEK